MNYIMEAQISNMIAIAKGFEQSCKIAAQIDDGTTSKAEMKILQKISTITEKYISELERIKNKE